VQEVAVLVTILGAKLSPSGSAMRGAQPVSIWDATMRADLLA
jgi:hypothetical protein